MTLKEQVKELREKQGMTMLAIAKQVGLSERSVGRLLNGSKVGKKLLRSTEPKDASALKTRSINDLVQGFDKVATILALLKTVPASETVDDEDLRVEAGVSQSQWPRTRGSTRLSGFWYKMPDNKTVWGTQAAIKNLIARIKVLV